MNTPSFGAPTPDLARAMTGLWRLVSRTDYDGEGRLRIDPIMGADPLGMLCFSGGYFSTQFMKRERATTPAPAPVVTGANNSGAVNGYDAYFGSYTVNQEAGHITITLLGAISPSNVGLVLTREIRVTDNMLAIQLATTAADGTPITRTLRFERTG